MLRSCKLALILSLMSSIYTVSAGAEESLSGVAAPQEIDQLAETNKAIYKHLQTAEAISESLYGMGVILWLSNNSDEGAHEISAHWKTSFDIQQKFFKPGIFVNLIILLKNEYLAVEKILVDSREADMRHIQFEQLNEVRARIALISDAISLLNNSALFHNLSEALNREVVYKFSDCAGTREEKLEPTEPYCSKVKVENKVFVKNW